MASNFDNDTKKRRLSIVDASSYLFRSYYAIGKMLSPAGRSTQALFGFSRFLTKLAQESYVVIVYDSQNNKESRLALYQGYKSHRQSAPEDLPWQIELSKQVCQAYGIPLLTVDGVEADDTIASIATQTEPLFDEIWIYSSDKDLAQCVTEKTFLIQPFAPYRKLDPKEVYAQFGVHPKQIPDFLALVGDSSDGIPGIAGIGKVRAATLLAKHPLVEEIPLSEEERTAALLYKKLTLLSTEIAIPKERADYAVKERDSLLIGSLFEELGFKSLLPKLSPKKRPSADLLLDLPSLEATAIIALVAQEEATSSSDSILELIFCTEEQGPWRIVYGAENHSSIASFLSSKRVVGHDLKTLLHQLKKRGLPAPSLHFDTFIAYSLLFPGESTNWSDLLERFSMESESDLRSIFPLMEKMKKKMEESHLFPLFHSIEMPLISLLFKMETKGIWVDRQELHLLSLKLSKQIQQIATEISQLAGYEINLNSPKQLASLLFEQLGLPKSKKGKSGHFSTNIDVLEGLIEHHPIIPLLIQYRSLEKIRSTYGEALIEAIDPQDSRVHTTFHQVSTLTGRLASSHPNLQNIPTTAVAPIRYAFKAHPNTYSLISADYSQAELRLLAHFSKEPKLIQAFEQRLDIHLATAASLFDLPLEAVTTEMRSQAKAVNFGIIYGLGAHGLSKNLNIPLKQASLFIQEYFNRYPAIADFIQQTQKEVEKKGYAETLLGRRRPIPEISSHHTVIRRQGERFAINSTIQGSQADLIKKAMIELNDALDPSIQMLLQIHDELLFECPDSLLDAAVEMIRAKMEHLYPLLVPLEVTIRIAKNWGDC